MAHSNREKACLVHGIFYGILIGLVILSAIFIFARLDPRLNKYLALEDDTNIYGDNPGLSFRPMTNDDTGTQKSIISYRSSVRESFLPLVNSLEDFLSVYRKPGLVPGRGSHIYNCDYHNPAPPGQVCDVDTKVFSPCIPEDYFGYHRSSPCVFLRLNAPSGWKPVFYNDTNSLPDEMPASLKKYIVDLKTSRPNELNTIWVSCEGENPADVEFVGPIEFHPRQGFPGYYYRNDEYVEGYLTPLIAVQFKQPKIGPLINIKCKAWARNIQHDNDSALGGVQFGLMLS